MTLPEDPRKRRFNLPPPSPRGREDTRHRLHRMVRGHEERERPFDPEQAPTWRGSARDLVANPVAAGFRGPVELFGYDEVERRWTSCKRWPNLAAAQQEIRDLVRSGWDSDTKFLIEPIGADPNNPGAAPQLRLNPGGFRAALRELVEHYKDKLRDDRPVDEITDDLERAFEDEETFDAMKQASDLLEGFGVESLGPVDMNDGPPYEYINFGDTYDPTIMYSRDKNKVFVAMGGWGDVWSEEGEPDMILEGWESWLGSEFQSAVESELEGDDAALERAADIFDNAETGIELLQRAMSLAQERGGMRAYPEIVQESDGITVTHLDRVVPEAATMIRDGWRPGQNERTFRTDTTRNPNHPKGGSASRIELRTMEDQLRQAGYDPGEAERLQAEGMGPDELDQRLTERGGLERTHRVARLKRWTTSYKAPGGAWETGDGDVYEGKRGKADAEEDVAAFMEQSRDPSDQFYGYEWAVVPWGHEQNPSEPGANVTPTEMAALIRARLRLGDRVVRLDPHDDTRQLFINYFNLPDATVREKRGGGAEVENNRIMITVLTPGTHGYYEKPVAAGTVRVKSDVNTVRFGSGEAYGQRERDAAKVLRGKTGTPERVAKYIADYLNEIAKTVPPKLTHHNNPHRALTRGMVLDAARIVGPTWGRKAWLSDVAAELGTTVHEIGPDLLRMHRAGDIELARCDLVQAAPAGKVAASELRGQPVGEYHLIVVP